MKRVKGILENEKLKKEDLDFDKRSLPSIALFLVFLLIGIGLFFFIRDKRNIDEKEEVVVVASTIFPINDMLHNVVDDTGKFEYIQLVPSYVDPLLFQPSDVVKDQLRDAKVVFKVGAGFDDWVDSYANETGTAVIDLSLIIEEKLKPDKETRSRYYDQLCRSLDGNWVSDDFYCQQISSEICSDIGGVYPVCEETCNEDDCFQVCKNVCSLKENLSEETFNWYYWLSIDNAKKMCEGIYSVVAQLKPEYIGIYSRQLENYKGSLDDVKRYGDKELEDLAGRKIISLKNEYAYMQRDYNFDYMAMYDYDFDVDIVSDESIIDLFQLIYNINTLYVSSTISAEEVKSVFGEDVEIRYLDISGSGTYSNSYIDMMKYNIDSIKGTVLYE